MTKEQDKEQRPTRGARVGQTRAAVASRDEIMRHFAEALRPVACEYLDSGRPPEARVPSAESFTGGFNVANYV